MKREIKFRAWGKSGDNYIFVYFDLFTITEDYFRNFTQENDGGYNIINKENVIDIQQYTGLQDTKKVKIYDGDIVKSHNGFIFEVKSEYGTFNLIPHTSDESFIPVPLIDFVHQIEVIGNIYQNPELLNNNK